MDISLEITGRQTQLITTSGLLAPVVKRKPDLVMTSFISPVNLGTAVSPPVRSLPRQTDSGAVSEEGRNLRP